MDMIGFLGKKVDIMCKDGEGYSGYVFDVQDAEDSCIGCDSFDIVPLDREVIISIPVGDVESVTVDSRYREFDFWNEKEKTNV